MGIIKALTGAVGGGLADQWLEVIEAADMSDTTVFSVGRSARASDRRNANKKGSEDFISDGSIIHVGPNMFMIDVYKRQLYRPCGNKKRWKQRYASL